MVDATDLKDGVNLAGQTHQAKTACLAKPTHVEFPKLTAALSDVAAACTRLTSLLAAAREENCVAIFDSYALICQSNSTGKSTT